MTAGRTLHPSSRDWGTPVKLVEAVRACLGGSIALDPCSNPYSLVGALTEYRLPEQDGLKEPWDFPTIYVNPPYGADKARKTTIRDWLARCAKAHRENGSEVLALVPVATNTEHWKRHVFGQAAGVCFLYDTRLKFLVQGKPLGKGAPMSCAMAYWGKYFDRFFESLARFGAPVDLRALQGKELGWGARLAKAPEPGSACLPSSP